MKKTQTLTRLAERLLSASRALKSSAFAGFILLASVLSPAKAQDSRSTVLTQLGQDLWAQSLEFDVWNFSSPSIAVHYFIGCGDPCKFGQENADIASNWLQFSIVPDSLQQLHRGQFESTLASLNIPLGQSIIYSDFEIETFGQKLEALALDFPPSKPFGLVEPIFGTEYGWVMAALCRNRTYVEDRVSNFSISGLVNTVIDNGLNLKLEGGSHEFEGLADCASELTKNAEERTLSKKISAMIADHASELLANRLPNGQLYVTRETDGEKKGPPGWAQCASPRELCRHLGDLLKQAHFFDWVPSSVLQTLPPKELDHALDRMQQLLEEVLELSKETDVKKSNRNWFLYVGAVSHSVRATRKLAEPRLDR